MKGKTALLAVAATVFVLFLPSSTHSQDCLAGTNWHFSVHYLFAPQLSYEGDACYYADGLWSIHMPGDVCVHGISFGDLICEADYMMVQNTYSYVQEMGMWVYFGFILFQGDDLRTGWGYIPGVGWSLFLYTDGYKLEGPCPCDG